jgi:hypothetical protein
MPRCFTNLSDGWNAGLRGNLPIAFPAVTIVSEVARCFAVIFGIDRQRRRVKREAGASL